MPRAHAVTMAASFALLTSACGAPVSKCAPDPWQGECQLTGVTKVEDKEFPVPHVVLEAMYRPLPNRAYPDVTPPAIAQRTIVKSELELQLRDHLEAHARVACAAPPPPSGNCAASQVTVSVPEFDVAAAEQRLAAPAVVGCAQLEASSAQDQVTQNRQTQTVVNQRFAFPEGSAQLPVEADTVAKQLAKMLSQKPEIECLGIVGQVSAGESPGLADERAKAVRDLLGAHGVALTRLLTIAATAKVFGTGGRPAEPDPGDRRVGFSVLLEKRPAP